MNVALDRCRGLLGETSGGDILNAIDGLASLPEERRLEEARRRNLFFLLAKEEDPITKDLGVRKLAKLLGVSRSTIQKKLLCSLPPQGPQEETEEDASLLEEGERFARSLGPNILDRVVNVVHRLGVVGEESLIKTLYLTLSTRLLDRPVSVAIQSAASTGKNFIVSNVLKLFPSAAYIEWTGMSERALVYTNEDFSHRTIVIHELGGIDSDIGNYLLRSLLSEGHLRYETVESTPSGLRPKTQEKPGPTNVIFTTTKVSLHPENATRLISVSTDDSPEQTARVLEYTARGVGDEVDTSSWRAFQTWLAAGPTEVVIPYAVELARAIPPKDPRLRRDFPNLLSLIRACALIHQLHRERDEEGRIIASLEDYAIVYDLYEPILSAILGAAVKQSVRETVEAVRELLEEGREYVTLKELEQKLNRGRDATARRIRECLKLGYLRDEEGGRRGRERHLVLGDPLPEDRSVLPHPSRLKNIFPDTPQNSFGNSEKYPEYAHLPGKTLQAKHSEKYRKNIDLSESGVDFSESGIDFSESEYGLNTDFSEFPNHFRGDPPKKIDPQPETSHLEARECERGYEVLSDKPHRIVWRDACRTLVVEAESGPFPPIMPWEFVFADPTLAKVPSWLPYRIAFVSDNRCWMVDSETFFEHAETRRLGHVGGFLLGSYWQELHVPYIPHPPGTTKTPYPPEIAPPGASGEADEEAQ